MTFIHINGAFDGQRITGQQRYATEISRVLLNRPRTPAALRKPPTLISKSRVLAWIWAQTLGLVAIRGGYLLTLTSRGPLVAPRHVIVVHDLFVLEHPEWYGRRYAVTHALALRAQIRTARLLVAVSEPVAAKLARMVRQRVPIVVAPNAPAAEFVERGRRVEHKGSPYPGLSDKRYFLTVASYDPRKNLSLLLKAHQNLPRELRESYPLVVVGGEASIVFKFNERDALRSAMQVGRVSDAELADLYAGASAVLFPSLDEGFGLPAVEALASGARLVASDIDTLRWVCGDHALFVDPQDLAGWTRAMERFAQTEPDRSNQGPRDFVLSRFAWELSAAAITTAILDVTSKKLGTRGE